MERWDQFWMCEGLLSRLSRGVFSGSYLPFCGRESAKAVPKGCCSLERVDAGSENEFPYRRRGRLLTAGLGKPLQ